MTTAPAAKRGRPRCEKPDCRFADDRLCIEDAQPAEDCPSLTWTLEEEDDDSGHASPDAKTPSHPAAESGVYHAEHLRLDQARVAVAGKAMIVISVVGDQKSGKTTLLAALLERFEIGPFGGFMFAGTDTPRAFDFRSHRSRVTSGRSTPTTERTHLKDGLHFLHLAVATNGPELRHELLFADRAGEHFEDMRRSSDGAQRLVELAAADAVLLLVDGDRLAHPQLRNGERHKAAVSARAIRESGILRQGTLLLVVLTKLDLVQAADQPDPALAAFEEVASSIARDSGSLLRVHKLHIAARPEKGSLGLGYNLDGMLEQLVAAKCAVEPGERARALPPNASEFDHFGAGF